MDDDNDGRDDEVQKFHLSKRARYNKTSVVVFDDEARKEFLSGFRKRKNKRRQIAAEQNQIKERQKRLQDRKERRQALKEAKEEASKGQGGVENGAADAEEEEDVEANETTIADTITYDERETRTVVNITPINPESDDDDEEKEVRTSGAGMDAPALKVKKPKFKKPKRPQSEKRTRKLSRREKTVPRNLRTKKRKKK